MLSEHHSAGKGRLVEHILLAGRVNDAVRTESAGNVVRDNYVVLNTSLPGFAESRLTSDQSPAGDQDLEFRVRVVAVDLAGLYLLMDAVSVQFVGHHLTVDGRSLTALRRTDFPEPGYDYTARVFFQDAYFEATSSRV